MVRVTSTSSFFSEDYFDRGVIFLNSSFFFEEVRFIVC